MTLFEKISLVLVLTNVAVAMLLGYLSKDFRNLRNEFRQDLANFKNEMKDEFDERYYLAAVQMRDQENYKEFCKRTHERIDKLENRLEAMHRNND